MLPREDIPTGSSLLVASLSEHYDRRSRLHDVRVAFESALDAETATQNTGLVPLGQRLNHPNLAISQPHASWGHKQGMPRWTHRT